MTRWACCLLVATACHAPDDAAHFAPPLPPPQDTAQPGLAQHVAWETSPSAVFAQSAWCVTTNAVAGGGVALLAVGLDDGGTAVLRSSGAGSAGTPSRGGLARYGDLVVWPGRHPNYAWQAVHVPSGTFRQHTTAPYAFVTATQGRLFTPEPGGFLRGYDGLGPLAADQPSLHVHSLAATALGASEQHLLNATARPVAVARLDPVDGLPVDGVPIPDFDANLVSLTGGGGWLFLLDDGTGPNGATHGRRLVAFDEATGAAQVEVYFLGWPSGRAVTLPAVGALQPSGLVCSRQ